MNILGILILVILSFVSLVLLAMPKRRKIGIFMLVMLLGSVAFLSWKTYQYDKGFAKIHSGATQQEVLAILGNPDAITDGTTTIYGEKRGKNHPAPVGCAEEYWYYAFFLPVAWEYSFDKDKKVIFQYNWVSP